MKVEVKGTPFKRDLNNMALLCSDKRVKAEYEIEMNKMNDNKVRDNEINKIKDDIAEIKQMLRALAKSD